jgi:hypothetical protein
MAVTVVVAVVAAVVVLAVLLVVVLVVTMQIHREERLYRQERRAWEERRQWNRALHREEIPIPLTRPARGPAARFARAVCGVYINGMYDEPARNLPSEEVLPWYERSSGGPG